MHNSRLLLVVLTLLVPFLLSAQQQPGKHFPKAVKGKEHLIDTRVDNMTYWKRMAEMGYVEVAPEVPVPPPVYTGSSINSRSITIEDSPDVAVTEENSTQSENSIFVNPLDNQNVLNSNNSTTNPMEILYGANDLYSFDQGETWQGEVDGAGGPNSGDPAVVISNTGIYYVGYIHSNYGQGVSYSTDQGQTWTPVLVKGGGYILDKNHLWIDNSPASPYDGYLYNAWTNFQGGSAESEIELARSIDEGQSWENAINISSAVNAGSHNQGVNINSGPNGEVYAIWSIYDSWPSDESAIGFARSYDGGATFEPATRIISNIRGIRTSETSKNQRVNSFPVLAVDISGGPYNGTLYAVWANIGVPGINNGPDIDIYMIKSTDQGGTWSDPVKVNQDPAGAGAEHYFPWITCDPVSGTLSVIFYDDRNVGGSQCEVFCAVSNDGGESWEDFKVSDVAFTPSPIPGLAGGYMGDYLGINARDRVVYPVWTDNRLGYTMSFVSPFITGPPANQPWITYEAHSIDDSQGNGNGQVDFGESVVVNLSMKNIGDQPATNVEVTVATDNPYITLTDNTENFGDFELEEIKNIDGAFAFDVAHEITDGTSVLFSINAVDQNDSLFTSKFTTTVYAPDLEIGQITIADPAGNNNGRLDPGEDVEIIIATSNPGSYSADNTMATLNSTSTEITLSSNSFAYNTIEAGETAYASFNATVSDGAMIGSVVDLVFSVASDYHSDEETFFEKVGLILEDFETGDFSQYDWMFGGNAGWEITQEDPYEGMYCIKSGAIGNSSTSEVYLEYEVMNDDSISFYRKVSSEAGYDYLEFYIDNTLVGQWAGEVSWGRVAFPVTAGAHTFKWVYSKDVWVTGGQDRAWIDYIELPPELRTTAFAGPDDYSCEGDPFNLNGTATNYESLLWTTSGTGTFDDETILDPAYTPSIEDLEMGSVELTLTVYGPTETISDDMLLMFSTTPSASAGENLAICDYESVTLEMAGAENYSELLWSTSGDGTFDDPSAMNPVYIPGEMDIMEGSATLTITAMNYPCSDFSDEVILTIHATEIPEIDGSQEACPGTEYSYIIDEYDDHAYQWEITGGTITEGAGSPEIMVLWDSDVEGELVVTLTSELTSCSATDTMPVSVLQAPSPQVSGMMTLCQGIQDVEYQTEMVEGNTYEWMIEGGAITEGQNTNKILVTWDQAGSGMVKVIETITETGCSAESMLDIEVNALPVVNPGNDTSICHNHLIVLDAGHPDAQSWNWSTGENTQTITVDSTGAGIGGTKEISVIVIDENGCEGEGSVSVYFEDCSGIPESAYDLGMILYPNPNRGSFTLKLNPQENDVVTLRILSSTGKLILKEDNIRLTGEYRKMFDLSTCTDGIYYLFIDSKKVHEVRKIVIEH